jgi:hypothetical protein
MGADDGVVWRHQQLSKKVEELSIYQDQVKRLSKSTEELSRQVAQLEAEKMRFQDNEGKLYSEVEQLRQQLFEAEAAEEEEEEDLMAVDSPKHVRMAVEEEDEDEGLELALTTGAGGRTSEMGMPTPRPVGIGRGFNMSDVMVLVELGSDRVRWGLVDYSDPDGWTHAAPPMEFHAMVAT